MAIHSGSPFSFVSKSCFGLRDESQGVILAPVQSLPEEAG
jgi:hypothetical protein